MTIDLDHEFSAHFLLDHVPCCCVVHGPDGQIEYLNDAAQEFFAIPKSLLLNEKKALDSWSLVDIQGDELGVENFPISFVLKHRKPYPPRMIGFQTPAGEVKWCLVRAMPKMDENGQLSSVFVTFTDETKQQRLLSQITEERNLLQNSERVLNAGSWSYDIAKNKIRWSDNIFTIFDLRPQRELSYQEYLSFLDDYDRLDISQKVQKAIEDRQAYEVFQTIKGKSIHGIGIPVTDPFGKVVRLHGILRDITEDVESKRKLEVLATVVEQTENVVVITGVDGKITWANSGYTDLTGYTLEESLGKKPGELLQGPDTNPETVKLLGQAIKETRAVTAEILNYSKNGEPYWLHINIQPIFDEKGQCISFAAIQLDLTERRAREEQLKNVTRDLNVALADKDKFYSVITHDLRSPFNGLIGLSEMVVEDGMDMEKEEIIETVGTVNRLSIQTLGMLDDFLAWISSKARFKEPEIDRVDLIKVLRQTKDFFADIAKPKEVDIHLDIPQSIHAFSNKDCLKTILRNLVSNAIKFSKRGGQIYLSLGSNGPNPKVMVRDTGLGMSDSAIMDLQQKGRTKSKLGSSGEEGYGLGLTLVYDLCSSIGAKIDIESAEGLGTCFTITLPHEIEQQS